MSDLPKQLRIKAGMIHMGERIAWGSDTTLMEEAADLIEQQAAEIDALKAHIERYNKAALDAIPMLYGGEIKANLRDVYDESPQTSLAEHDAEVAHMAFIQGAIWDAQHDYSEQEDFSEMLTKAANEYAQRIKDGK